MDKNNINKNNDENLKPKHKDIKDNTKKEVKEELSTEEKIKELDDKLARAYAEMENQRRRYEREKDDAFEYGGFTFARETLNLLDNLDRSKISLENDEKLKNSDSLKKIFEHLDIIKKDMGSIFKKIPAATSLAIPFLIAPSINPIFCFSSSALFFFPIALLNKSA